MSGKKIKTFYRLSDDDKKVILKQSEPNIIPVPKPKPTPPPPPPPEPPKKAPVIIAVIAALIVVGAVCWIILSQNSQNPETVPAVVSQDTAESSVVSKTSQNSVKKSSSSPASSAVSEASKESSVVPSSVESSVESSETHESPESSVQPIQETSVEPVISSQPVPSQPVVSSQPSELSIDNPGENGDVADNESSPPESPHSSGMPLIIPGHDKTGQCGGNISYKLENGTLTLTGTGSMYDDFEEFQNDDSIKTVIVNAGITGISAYAFSGCSALESVDMSKSDIKTIRYCTFENCTALKNVTLPPNLEKIEEYAFASCTSLTALTIPESVSDIDETAFEDCPIDIP